jgi:protein-S-isoprenylcysteine O-methyltransferase Ste14
MKLIIYYLLLLPLFGGFQGFSTKYDRTQIPLKLMSGLIPVIYLLVGPLRGIKEMFPGVVLMLIGAVLALLAKLKLKGLFTCRLCILPNHKIIKTGIYKYVRHPAYIGYMFIFAGSTLMTQSVILMIFSLMYSGLLFYRMKVENSMLRDYFGRK